MSCDQCGHSANEHLGEGLSCSVVDCRCQMLRPRLDRCIEPSQARYRSTMALHRLATALGIELRAEEEDCLCLERLASQAERWRRFDERAPDGEGTREKAYAGGYGSDTALRGEGEP